jgi:hypothetical protein
MICRGFTLKFVNLFVKEACHEEACGPRKKICCKKEVAGSIVIINIESVKKIAKPETTSRLLFKKGEEQSFLYQMIVAYRRKCVFSVN